MMAQSPSCEGPSPRLLVLDPLLLSVQVRIKYRSSEAAVKRHRSIRGPRWPS